MSKISLGKFKMLEALVRNFPLRGKSSSLLTVEWYSQHSTGPLFISRLRGKGRREAGTGQ